MCLNCERNPPTVMADVFIWNWSEDDPCRLVCLRVPKQEHESVLFDPLYRHLYDSRLNVWKVCKHFNSGEGCGDEDDEDDSVFGTSDNNMDLEPDTSSTPAEIQQEVERFI